MKNKSKNDANMSRQRIEGAYFRLIDSKPRYPKALWINASLIHFSKFYFLCILSEFTLFYCNNPILISSSILYPIVPFNLTHLILKLFWWFMLIQITHISFLEVIYLVDTKTELSSLQHSSYARSYAERSEGHM